MGQPTPPVAPGAPTDAGTAGQAPTGTQQPTTPTAPPQQQQQPTGQAPNQQQTQQGSSADQQDIASLPAWAQKIITDTRAEAAKHRTEKQTAAQQAQTAQQQRDAILKAAGFTPDGKDAPPDPDALAAQIEQANAVAWTNAVELAVTRTAQAAGADVEKLLDSRAFVDSLDDFTEDDPASPEFRTKLDEHIKAYVEKHPQFKQQTQPIAPRSGTPLPPGGTGTGAQRPRNIGEALKRKFGTT